MKFHQLFALLNLRMFAFCFGYHSRITWPPAWPEHCHNHTSNIICNQKGKLQINVRLLGLPVFHSYKVCAAFRPTFLSMIILFLEFKFTRGICIPSLWTSCCPDSWWEFAPKYANLKVESLSKRTLPKGSTNAWVTHRDRKQILANSPNKVCFQTFATL